MVTTVTRFCVYFVILEIVFARQQQILNSMDGSEKQHRGSALNSFCWKDTQLRSSHLPKKDEKRLCSNKKIDTILESKRDAFMETHKKHGAFCCKCLSSPSAILPLCLHFVAKVHSVIYVQDTVSNTNVHPHALCFR